ncbi:MAG: hypothetical protein HY054_07555 [Proteobacteria bacterium]|nr:hypothetical protein [Pseudomonadota bacterium]
MRRGAELTLINPIRCNADCLRDLDKLGAVKHVIRLGGFHGADDPFYINRYRATFWAPIGELGYQTPLIDKVLLDGGELPFTDALLFCFKGARVPEAAICITRGNGLLLTCDAIQHYGDYSQNNLAARMAMPFIGFPKRVIIGPIWLQRATTINASLRPEFDRLLKMKFDALFAAHGTYLAKGAHAGVRAAVDATFDA